MSEHDEHVHADLSNAKKEQDDAFPPQPDFDRDAENESPPEKTEGS